MAYKVIILYQLYMPSYFLGTFTEYPYYNMQYLAKDGQQLLPFTFIKEGCQGKTQKICQEQNYATLT